MKEVSQRPSRITLKDVANLAGVSPSTASLVLSDKANAIRISEDTQRRVTEAAESLNYVPSLLHRSVRSGKTGIICFYNAFRNRVAGDLYMDRMSAAIEHAGGHWRYNVLVHCDYSLSVDETYKFLNGGFADGVILFSPKSDDPLLERLRTSSLPTVILNPRSHEPTLSTIREDERHGAVLIANTLLDAGHRNIAILVQKTPGWPAPQDRERAIRRALRERDATCEIKTVVTSGDFHEDVREILRAPRPSVVFVWNDRTAYVLLDACRDLNIQVPDELSVMGYDGILWPSATNQIVTSVRAPFNELAEATIQRLDEVITGRTPKKHIRVLHELVPGTTLKTLPGRIKP